MTMSTGEENLVWIAGHEIRSGFYPPNLRFLRRYHPDLVSVQDCAMKNEERVYGFQRGRRGICAVRFHCGDGWSLWREDISPDAPVQSAEEACEKADLIYLVGIGLGGTASGIYRRILGRNKGLFIIEPEGEFLLAAMSARDLRGLLSSGQVFLAVGPTWEEQLFEIMERRHLAAAALPVIRAAIDPVGGWEQTVLGPVCGAVQQAITRLQPRLKQGMDEWIAETHSPARRPGKVIWAFQDSRGIAPYSLIQLVLLRSLFYRLRRFGWTVRYTHLRDGNFYPPYYRIWELVRARPDVLFFCNVAPSFEFALGPELSAAIRIPKVIWHTDDPFYCRHLYLRHGVRAEELYLAADLGWIGQLEDYGAAGRTGFLPGAATITRPGKRSKRLASDIVFVGQVRAKSSFLEALSPGHRDYCERIVSEKLANPRVSLAAIMSQRPFPGISPGEDILDEMRQRILWEANTRHRLEIVRHLEDLGLVIYGNTAWLERLPDGPNKERFRGTLPFGKLAHVYRNAIITLNIHSLQTYTCLNVRDFDVPASGGFLLSDWLPRVDDFFVPGFSDDLDRLQEKEIEIFLYRNPTELRCVVSYFLENPEARHPIIERARQRVIEYHTYSNRAKTLAQLLTRVVRGEGRAR
ncbi:MAG TPA: glycosyltransferase [bacterium]|nr:glycosyltransferase [bacterium]HQL63055.1 glycosyltransferase [bacterium]